MLAEQRRFKILELVREEGSARVSNLSKLFGVSEPTIRQDLEGLIIPPTLQIEALPVNLRYTFTLSRTVFCPLPASFYLAAEQLYHISFDRLVIKVIDISWEEEFGNT